MPIETAPAGATLHAVAEEGIPGRDFAEVIRHKLDIPVISVAPENALDHFGFLGFLLPMDSPASSEYTRQVLGWEPTFADIDVIIKSAWDWKLAHPNGY